MRRLPAIPLLLITLGFLLSACGKDRKLHILGAEKLTKKSFAIRSGSERQPLAGPEFSKRCREKHGIEVRTGEACVRIERVKSLDPENPEEQLVDERATIGRFLVVLGSAPGSSAFVLLDSAPFTEIPSRRLIDRSGRLSLRALRPGASGVRAEIWECLDRFLEPVACAAELIP